MITAAVIADEFRAVHDRISEFLVQAGGPCYREDSWNYDKGSGGGLTRVWEESALFEKGGVNYSAIHGQSLPASAAAQFQFPEDTPFFATGVSLVMHPWNPHVPTIHMNIRYVEAESVWWFGGGMDLTPYYPVRADVIAFHHALKEVCEQSGQDYAAHKTACDEYFYLPHRREMRGVGGIFFDHVCRDKRANLAFAVNLGQAFPAIYGPLIEANRNHAWTERQREFQLLRRARYVEFNLLYDRGTRFGLQSEGRIESILMSLPAVAKWKYDWTPEPGSPEAEAAAFYFQPRDGLET